MFNKIPFVAGLGKFECARYVRILAGKLSGARYSICHAWEFENVGSVVSLTGGIEEMYFWEENGLFVPGQTIVFFL